MQATGHEAKTKFPKKALQQQIHLRLPDLEHAKAAVLNSQTPQMQSGAIVTPSRSSLTGNCSEPRLAFSRVVVLRYRSHLESRQLAPGHNQYASWCRLGAVRRLAYEAADCGLLKVYSAPTWRPAFAV
jgi:hypothetical protein